jgi:excisionase family DNA binding protein
MIKLFLPREAAAHLRISKSKLYQLIKKGKLQPYTVAGCKTVFREQDLEALLHPAPQLVIRNPRGRPRKVPSLFPI